MILFLTSSPSGPLDKPNYGRVLDRSNGFVDNLKKYWKEKMIGLIISADPYNYSGNDEMCSFFSDAFRNSGIPVEQFDILDYRKSISETELGQYDVIMLAGGHVPTQNHYFHKIQLRECLKGYEGIVIGVSAGTMNCADIVYAQPEMPYESIDPNYQRFITGLGLTEFNVLPHYRMVKASILDNQRLYEDITYPDSYKRCFTILCDGSYILIDSMSSKLYGEAYCLFNGKLEELCHDNEWIYL